MHPILWLLTVNVSITLYAFSRDHILVAAVFGVLLPAGFLAGLAQTFRIRVACSNHGVFPRAERPASYWFSVAVLIVAYLFTSAAPLLARYFPPSALP